MSQFHDLDNGAYNDGRSSGAVPWVTWLVLLVLCWGSCYLTWCLLTALAHSRYGGVSAAIVIVWIVYSLKRN